MTIVVKTLTISFKLMILNLTAHFITSFQFEYLDEAVSLMRLREFSFNYENKTYQIVQDENLSNDQPVNDLETFDSKHCTLNPCEQLVISQLFLQKLKESKSFANLKIISAKIILLLKWQDNQLLPEKLNLKPKEVIFHKIKNFNIYSPLFWYPRLIFKTNNDVNLETSLINNPCIIKLMRKKALVTCFPEFDVQLQCKLNSSSYPHGLINCPIHVSPIQSIGNIILLLPINQSIEKFFKFNADLKFSQLELVSHSSEKVFCFYTNLPMTVDCGGIKASLILKNKSDTFLQIYGSTIILMWLSLLSMWQSIEGPIRALFTIGIFLIFQTFFIFNQEYHFSSHYAKNSLLEFWIITCYLFSIFMCLQYLITLISCFFKSYKVIKGRLETIRYDIIINDWSKYIFTFIAILLVLALFAVISQLDLGQKSYSYVTIDTEKE